MAQFSTFNFLFLSFNFVFNTQTILRSRFQLVRAGFDHCKEGLNDGRFCCNRQYWVQDQSARHHWLRHLARSGGKYFSLNICLSKVFPSNNLCPFWLTFYSIVFFVVYFPRVNIKGSRKCERWERERYFAIFLPRASNMFQLSRLFSVILSKHKTWQRKYLTNNIRCSYICNLIDANLQNDSQLKSYNIF